MKRILMFLCSVALVFGMVGFASAAPMEWEDCIAFGPEKISAYETFGYYHDLGNGGFVPVLEGGSDIVTDYTLYVTLADDSDTDGGETGWIKQLGTVFNPNTSTRYNWSWELAEIGKTVAGLLDINHDGTLNVWVSSTRGDFNLIKSCLVGSGYGCGNETAPVPEPSTMLLLGVGLLGLVGYGRKRFNQKH